MKPMNDNEFKDKLSKTIANTLNALSSKETPRVKKKSDLAGRDSESETSQDYKELNTTLTKVFSDMSKAKANALREEQ